MDEHFRLPGGGIWRTLPFQRGIANAMTDPDIESVSLLKSSRVGYTKLVCGYIGWRIHLDPTGILVVQPAQEDAEGFSKDEIATMLREVRVLDGIVAEAKSRDSGNTILKKHFPGGHLTIGGAHSARVFRRLTCGAVIFDEVDGYPPSAGTEGDQLSLGRRRAQTEPFPKFIYGSSPGIKEASRIEKLWEVSDQRDYVVPCPHCEHGQRLQWGGRDADFGVKWPEGRPEDAYYLCEHCHCEILEIEKSRMVERGEWVVGAPQVKDHAGFRIWAGYSPFPQASWGRLAQEWEASQGNPEALKTFVNTVLGETWEERYESLNHETLMLRRERYPEVEDQVVVPGAVAVMTAGVDVQDDRLELQVDGWGRGEECWKLEYHVLYGDPASPGVWDELAEKLAAPRRMERGGEDWIRATCVDTGGHHTQASYNFCRPRFRLATPDGRRQYVFAIKGQAGQGTIWPKEASRRNIGRLPLWPLKVDPAKEQIYYRAQHIQEPGAGYIHFPMAFGQTYFQGFDSEKLVPHTNRAGFTDRRWELKSQGRRNEPWDTAVYSYAALRGLVDGMGLDFDVECERIENPPEPVKPAPKHAVPETKPDPRRSEGWMGPRGKRWLG